MSIRVMTMVWDVFPASGSELLAMLALADWCDDQGGSLNPSMRAVAQKIRVSEKQARRIVQGFVSSGYLAVVGNATGGVAGTTKQFQLDVKKLAGLPLVGAQKSAPTAPVDGRGTAPMDGRGTAPMDGRGTAPTHVLDGSHPCPYTAPTGGSLTVIDPSIDPSVGRERAQAPATTIGGAGFVESSDSAKTIAVAAAAPSRHKTRLTADFQPDDAALDLAGQLGVSVAAEMASFADHHVANGSTMVDWQAAFRNWLRNAAKFAQRDAVRAAGPSETAYQRSMRLRVEEISPSIARKAPGAAPAMQAVDFFNSVNTASCDLHVVSDVSVPRIGSYA